MTTAHTTQLNVTGMTCGHCQSAVTKALKAVPGVEAAEVDLASGRAVIHGAALPEALMEAVADEGYSAEVVRADATSPR